VTGPGDGSVRPWGSYIVLDDSADDHKVKRMTVSPGQRLSYQAHARRSEHWFIVSGVADVLVDGVERRLEPGDSIDIPVGAKHRCTNLGTIDVVFVEVQLGDYFGEDDIVRYEDDYGRID
jgi:mannose-6-phosphate isomerase